MAETRPSIAVIIVAWNGRDRLASCLRALSEQTDRDFSVVLVDNGSEDGTGSWIRCAYPDVVCIRNEENLGFAAGCNLGIDGSRSDWVATLNDDAWPDPKWIEALRAAAHRAPPWVGMLQSDVRCSRDPAAVASRGVELRSDGVLRDCSVAHCADGAIPQSEIFIVSATAALYRREMLEEIRISSGIFDPEFFAYFEDVDLGWRARLAGWGALLVREARVVHAEHSTAKLMPSGFLDRQCRKNRVRVFLKNASFWFLLRTLPRILRDILRLAGFGFAELQGFFAGAKDGLRQRREVDQLIRVSRRDLERRWVQVGRSYSAREDAPRSC